MALPSHNEFRRNKNIISSQSQYLNPLAKLLQVTTVLMYLILWKNANSRNHKHILELMTCMTDLIMGFIYLIFAIIEAFIIVVLCQNIFNSSSLVLHICVSELGQHWFRQWIVAWSAQSHYLNQWWNIVNFILRNKLQWKLIKMSAFSFKEMLLKILSAKLSAKSFKLKAF